MLYPKQNSKRMRFALAVVLLLSLALCVGVSAAAPLSLEVASASAGPSIHVSDAVPAFASPMGDGWPPMTYDGHDGLDYPAPQGTPVYAAAGGTVLYAAPEAESDGYGNVLVIDHGNGYATLYAHCHELFAQAGDRVARGEVIAAVGQTGYSTGNHLHFELRLDGEPLDPAPYLP